MRDRLHWQYINQFMIVFITIVGIACFTLGQVEPVQAQSVDELKNYQNFVDQQRQIIQKQQEQINALAKPAQSRLDALRKNVRVTEAQIQDNEKKFVRLAINYKLLVLSCKN